MPTRSARRRRSPVSPRISRAGSGSAPALRLWKHQLRQPTLTLPCAARRCLRRRCRQRQSGGGEGGGLEELTTVQIELSLHEFTPSWILRFDSDGCCQGLVVHGAAELTGGVESHLPAVRDVDPGRRHERDGSRLTNLLIGDLEDVQEQGAARRRSGSPTSMRQGQIGGFSRPSVMWLYCAVGLQRMAPGLLARARRAGRSRPSAAAGCAGTSATGRETDTACRRRLRAG